MVWAAIFGLPQAAEAAQVSSGMGVGLTIAPSYTGGENYEHRRVFVSALVTRAVPANSYTWNAAAISVKRAGFKQPRRVEKSPTLYWFYAQKREADFRIAVSIASGRIVKIVRV